MTRRLRVVWRTRERERRLWTRWNCDRFWRSNRIYQRGLFARIKTIVTAGYRIPDGYDSWRVTNRRPFTDSLQLLINSDPAFTIAVISRLILLHDLIAIRESLCVLGNCSRGIWCTFNYSLKVRSGS